MQKSMIIERNLEQVLYDALMKASRDDRDIVHHICKMIVNGDDALFETIGPPSKDRKHHLANTDTKRTGMKLYIACKNILKHLNRN
tara:strand:- start:1168 stop:1425 length:258 start_codon:yes stop_codon:yes gene_type:complete